MKQLCANMARTEKHLTVYPWVLSPQALPGNIETQQRHLLHQLDLSEALELGQAGSGTGLDNAAAAAFASVGRGDLLIGALILICGIALAYLLRKRLGRIAALPAFSAVCAIVLIAPHYDGEKESLPTDPPWEGQETRVYAHPKDATLAILHGIIRPALMGMDQKVDTLANIQHEVALPMKSLSPGAAYALKMYGLDGWGNRINFSYKDEGDGKEAFRHYILTSLGPDGAVDTADDITVTLDEAVDSDGGGNQCSIFYLIKEKNDVEVLYRRWGDDISAYNNRQLATTLAGSDFFDVIDRARLEDGQKSAVDSAYAQLANEKEHPPIVLQVFDSEKI